MLEINAANWQSEVIESSTPVLVDFWAEWCGPCRALLPILEEISTELGDRLKIAKVNVDENQELAGQFSVRSIPCLLVIKDGVVAEQMIGMSPKAQLLEKIEPHLA